MYAIKVYIKPEDVLNKLSEQFLLLYIVIRENVYQENVKRD